MNTRRRILMVSGVLLCLLVETVRANPNHLEPIRPYAYLDIGGTIHRYRQAVFTSLIGTGWTPSLWMIERPSFSREYAVIVWCSIEYDRNGASPRRIKRRQWMVEYVVPKEKTWRWKSDGDGSESLDIRVTKDVERHRVPIRAEVAEAVQEAWWSTLHLTRYAESDTQGLDGTTLEFCCEGMFGQTWSPRTGLPAMLEGLGHKLREIALSDEKGRDSLVAEADGLARQITKEAEAEQIKLFGKKRSMDVRRAGR
jgi:hypothetical protein